MKPWSVPNISEKPTIQNNTLPHMKSQKFFIRMLAVFFERVMPASTKAKPGCIQNTSIAPNNTHSVSTPLILSIAETKNKCVILVTLS